jgi:hypothetical protein
MSVKKYRFRPDHERFTTGRTADGSQALIAHTATDVAVFSFAKGGTYRGCEAVPMPVKVRKDRKTGAFAGFDDAYWQIVHESLQGVRERLGFAPAPIEIAKLREERFHARIQTLPDEFEQFLKHPEDEDEEERTEMRAAIAAWRREKRFVWVFWNIEHWMSAEGELLCHG